MRTSRRLRPDLATGSNSSRRDFLRSAVATGVTLAAGPYIVRGRTQNADQEQEKEATTQPSKYKDVRIAFVGTGGIGGAHFDWAVKELGVNCPCYCDVDTGHYGPFAEKFPQAKAYQDYREMFDKEQKNFDAVMIGTPDHHHFPATIIAMQLGKHVYTQKPLTHTPWEARQLIAAAKKYKVATQMGNQGHSMEGWRMIYEWVQSGALGDIKETHTWTDRPIWPQGYDRPDSEDRVPRELDWDCWLGPAPERPFKAKWSPGGRESSVYHPFAWRGWWDFGCGALGDMACHTMDAIFGTFAPGYPTAIEVVAATPIYQKNAPEPKLKGAVPQGEHHQVVLAGEWQTPRVRVLLVRRRTDPDGSAGARARPQDAGNRQPVHRHEGHDADPGRLLRAPPLHPRIPDERDRQAAAAPGALARPGRGMGDGRRRREAHRLLQVEFRLRRAVQRGDSPRQHRPALRPQAGV